MNSRRPPLKEAAVVGDLILALLRQQGLAGKMEEYRAWQVWEAAVGPQIAARARPVRIREGVLEVRVEHAVWMQQLQLLKPQILAQLNERLGRTVFRDIFWRRGRLGPDARADQQNRSYPNWRTASLTDEEQTMVERATAAVGDAELRGSLQRLLLRQKCLNKVRQG